jgi:hypothetical protein
MEQHLRLSLNYFFIFVPISQCWLNNLYFYNLPLVWFILSKLATVHGLLKLLL